MIPVTAEGIRSVYVMLQSFPPFSRWNLPKAEKITFSVVPFVGMWSDFDPKTNHMRVSEKKITTFLCLVEAVAHEMCHMRQEKINRWSSKNPHNEDFKKMTSQVCKHFPFMDPGNF